MKTEHDEGAGKGEAAMWREAMQHQRAEALVADIRNQNFKNGGVHTMDFNDAVEEVLAFASVRPSAQSTPQSDRVTQGEALEIVGRAAPDHQVPMWLVALILENKIGPVAPPSPAPDGLREAREALRLFKHACRTDISKDAYDALRRLEAALALNTTPREPGETLSTGTSK